MDNDDDTGRYFRGTTDTNIPVQAGNSDAPQKSESHRQAMNWNIPTAKTAPVAKVHDKAPT